MSKAILSEFDPQLSLLVDHLSGCGTYHKSPVLGSVGELNFVGTYVDVLGLAANKLLKPDLKISYKTRSFLPAGVFVWRM